MKRVLVSGAAGFVGANLVRRLLADGHDVHALAKPGSHLWRLEDVRDDVHLHEVSLTDEASVIRVCRLARPEWIFHLAAHGAYPTAMDARVMIQTNIIGTLNFLEAALRFGFETFVHAGSSSEYGFKSHATGETDAVEPNSNYAVTKASATLLCSSFARRHQARILTLRLYSAFGPYEEPTRLIPTLIVRGLGGELPPLVSPDVARDYVDIRDVDAAFLLAATRPTPPGGIYNVGTGVQTSIRDVVGLARRVLGIHAEPQWGSMPDRVWDTSVWVANNSKIHEALGWQARFTLEAGFRAMVRWLLDNPQYHRRYANKLAATH